MFDEIDTNKNNSIDPKELKEAMIRIGINPSPEELTDILNQFD
jgi:Ca2+-binding EF-hand superfamily protein